MKKVIHIPFLLLSGLLGISLLGGVQAVHAASTWSQTDWSGGVGTSTTTQYNSASSVETSTSGQFSLSPTSSWYNINWAYRKKITFSNSGTENLQNFPVVIQLTSSNFDFTKAQSAAQDIRFTDSDGTTLLSYEIESWTSTSGSESGVVWVKVPQIDASSTTDSIYIYYGNASANDAQTASSVWESNFLGVYHAQDSLSGSTVVNDSTSNNFDGTAAGGMAAANHVTAKVGSGLDFDGVDDVVSVPDSSSLELTDDLTLEAWLKADTAGTALGTVGDATLDSLEFDTSDGQTPSLVQVSSTVYAVAYSGPSNDGFISTFTIDSSGNISNSIVDTLEYDTANGNEPSLIQVASGVYAIAYRGTSSAGKVVTVTIDSSGNISNSVVDTLTYDSSTGFEPSLVQVSSTVYAVAYRSTSATGKVVSITIDSSGNISNAVVDTLTYESATDYEPVLLQVSTTVYAVAYRGPNSDGFISSFTIDSSGNISNSIVDTLEYDTSDGDTPSLIQVASGVFAIAYRGPSNDGFVSTFTIDSSGNISNSIVDTLEYDTSDGDTPSLIQVASGVFAIAYRGPSNDGFVSTVTIDSSGNISNSIVDTLEYDTSDGDTPFILPVVGNIFAIGFTGPSSDGFIKTVQIVAQRGIYKDSAYGIDATTSTASATINEQAISTSLTSGWNHVVLTYNKDASSNQQQLYLNGSLLISGTLTASVTTNTFAFYLGQYVDGQLDEVRLSNSVRSAAWINATYLNQTNTFTSLASEEQRYATTGSLTSAVFDTTLSNPNWGAASYTSTGTGSVSVKIRTSNSSSMTGATAFSSCTAITSGADISSNGCVTDGNRYAQYEVTLTSSSVQTPTFQDISIIYEQPTITFSSSSATGAESNASVSASLSLSAVSNQAVTVSYTVSSSSTATSGGVDYTLSSSTATISAGSTSTTIPLTVVDDLTDESDETIILTLGSPTNATLGSSTTYTYTILDDDLADPEVQMTLADLSATESSLSQSVGVSLNAAGGQAVVVSYTVASSSTATGGGVDYTLANNQITIAAGATSGSIPLTVVNDLLDESNETIIITLTSVTHASLGASQTFTFTILDNDATPQVSSVTATTIEDTALTLSLNGSDADGDTLSFSLASQASQGDLSGLSSSTGVLTYTPGSNFNGNDSFSYTVSDGTNQASGTVAITVTAVNDTPTANAGSNQQVNEDVGSVVLVGTGSDVENSSLTYEWTESVDSGDGCSLNSFSDSAPQVTLTNKESSFSCIFQLVVNDGVADSAADSVTVNIVANNDAPEVETLADQIVSESQLLELTLAASDPDTGEVDISVQDVQGDFLENNVNLEQIFSMSTSTSGTLRWTPTFTQAGTYQLAVTVDDGASTNTQHMDITVDDLNQAPSFTRSLPNVSMTAGTTAKVFDLDNYTTDIDGEDLTFAVVGAQLVTATISNGAVELSAASNSTGSDRIRFVAQDEYGNSTLSNSLVVTVNTPTATAENVSYVTGKAKGKGVVRAYAEDNTLLAQWTAFPSGGVVPRIIQVDGQSYVICVKKKPGTTMHVYKLSGKLEKKLRISHATHWRIMAAGEVLGGDESQEIVTATVRGSQVSLKVWSLTPGSLQLHLEQRQLVKGIKSHQMSLLIQNNTVQLFNHKGKSIYTWQVPDSSY